MATDEIWQSDLYFGGFLEGVSSLLEGPSSNVEGCKTCLAVELWVEEQVVTLDASRDAKVRGTAIEPGDW